MRTFEKIVNGIRHRCYSWGNSKKPPLLLLHGWLDTGASFDFLCKELSKKFYCVSYDMRGYGKSAHSKSPLGYFFYEYVADLAVFVDWLFPNKPARILGHSLGGGVSTFYSGAKPDRVSHFINIEGFGFKDTPASTAPERARKWLDGIEEQKFRPYSTLKELATRLQKSNPNLKLDRALFLAKHLAKKTKKGWIMAADPLHKLPEPYWTSVEAFAAFSKAITAKCLLVSAANTEMAKWVSETDFPTEIKKRLAAFPTHSQVVEIKNAGHMVHHENPEDLAKVVLEFL